MGDFEGVLTALLSIDNEVRRQAEDAVKRYSNKTEVIPELLKHLQGAGDPQVRQLAAVLLRKWIARHWAKLTPEVQAGAQQLLLDRIVHEQVHSVRRALADVAASTAQQTVPLGQWPGLMGFLHQCSAADSPEHREVGLLMFGSLFETIGDHLQPHVPNILQALAAGASHPSSLVQTAALNVIEPLLPYITDAQVAAFHSLLAALLPCAQAALAAQNEALLVQLCRVLVDVAECPAPLLQPCLQQVLEMSMTVATNKQFSWDTREQALYLLMWMAKYKPKQLTRLKPLLRAVVDALCEMCCEPIPPELEDSEELSPAKAATQALDVLSINLASQHVFPAVWQFAQAAAASHDQHRRAGAMMVLAILAEGCSEALRRRLPQALPLLLAALSDPAADVRCAAAFALGQFSEWLQPDVLKHYRDLIPGVFTLLRDPNKDVQERACYALDTFCENLEAAEILPYMSQLVPELLQVMQGNVPGVCEMAISAISSVAAAAEQAFQPYTGQMLPVLQHYMQHTGQDYLDCRCRAVECAGIIVTSIGAKDPVIGPHVGAMMEAVLAGYASVDSPDLRDHSHAMFANVAKALGEDFAPFLSRVVPLAFASCKQEDGGEVEAGTGSESEDGDEDLGIDGDYSSDGGRDRHFNVRTGVMDEKMSATAALGGYADACPHAFMPYAEEALSVLTLMSTYWHEEARAAAFDSLQKLALAAHRVFPPAAAGPPVALSQQAHVMSEAVLPLLIACVEDDVAKPAVSAAAGALAQLLKRLGQGAVGPTYLEGAANMARLILQNKALCQEVEDDDDVEQEPDDEDLQAEDEDLVAAAADLLPALASSMGADAYAAVFLSLHAEPLIARLKPQQPAALRAIAAGAAAEVAEALGGRIAPVVGNLMPLLLREMQSDDDINRQNAAFCSGLLVEASPQQAAPFLTQLLTALHNMFRPDEAAGARDNAVGAVGRTLSALPQGSLPLEHVLPVFLGGLPLQEDLSETTPAVGALCKLLLSDQLQEVQQYVPQIVQVFGQVAVQIAAPTQAKVSAAQTLATLQNKFPEHMLPLLSQLPQEQQLALQQLVAAG